MAATHQQRIKAAMSLARGSTQLEASEAAKVSRATVAKWVKRPDFIALVAAYKSPAKPAAVIPLTIAPPVEVGTPASLPADWRRASALQLAAGVPSAVSCITNALTTDDPPTKAQLDTARWVIERMGIVAPEEVAQDEIVTVDDMVAELRQLDPRLLRLALEDVA